MVTKIFFRVLYWIQDDSIYQSSLSGYNKILFICQTNPLTITIDYLTRTLYWTERNGSIWKSEFDGSNRQEIYSSTSFSPLRVNIMRNYILTTSEKNTTYLLIPLSNLSLVYYLTVNYSFYGLSVISRLKKPFQGEEYFGGVFTLLLY